MTDLNKEREAFLGFLRTKGVVKVGWNSLGVLTNLVREAGCTLSYNDIELMQEVWMEKAKAQAVPDTHTLVSNDKLHEWYCMAVRSEELGCPECYEARGYVHNLACELNEASESGAVG